MGQERPGQSAPIVLIGLPGAGKTSVGEILAAKLECSFFDSDRLIETREKRTVSSIFKEDGEKRFREMESEILERFASGSFVLSCGGGLPMTKDNMDKLLDLGTVVYLKTSIGELMSRLSSAHDRPLLKSNPGESQAPDEHVLRNRLTTLEAERCRVYERAHLTVLTDGLSTDAVAEKVLQQVG